ncbi:MAG TPA: chemotaxis protein CheA, partial [Vicinamibacteria bacterium]|nr:chemotaxis protein CheA [Vicinamibacteria bacterium]
EGLREIFLAETDEGLAAMEESLVALESAPDDSELVHSIFRVVHTIKGGAAIVGFAGVVELAHGLEDALDQVRDRAVAVTPALITILLKSVDALRAQVEAALKGLPDVLPSHLSLLERLRSVAKEGHVAPATRCERPLGAGRRLADLVGDGRGEGGTLRVTLDKLDRLLTVTGELAINRGRLGQLLDAGTALDVESCRDVFREADRLFADLQQTVMQARMVPLGPIFVHQRRMVRDQAEALGKQARVVIEGGGVEVDTRIVEHIHDPLLHLVRNALDHGLEAPAARKALGKDPCGTVTLSAFHEAGRIVIRVADDGMGVDLERVHERGRQRGLLASAGGASEAELLRLILEPGFSTVDTVTGISGRGVGLDVVRRNIEILRGTLTVESRRGEGTTFTIRLPLTLAIIAGFCVRSAGETYVIPLDSVLECLELPAESSAFEGGGVAMLRERPLPLVRLREHLALGGIAPGREHVLVVEQDGLRVGLVVDELLGGTQAVVKPFGQLLQAVPGLVGSTIEGTGKVALILDVAEIVRAAAARDAGASNRERRGRFETGGNDVGPR